MALNRKSFLANVGCATAGLAAGILGDRWVNEGLTPAPAAPPLRIVPPRPNTPQPAPHLVADVRTYSQAGEDAAVRFTAQYLGIRDITYLDVGAYDPVLINNTYLFYRLGHRGVLVEPNVTMCKELRRVRPEDTVLEAGIGVTAVREADYYLMSDPSWNTFSKEEAEHQEEVTGGRIAVREVIKMPLLDINDVMQEHFDGAPAYLSVDAEGLHLAILQSIDYTRYRPPIICVETLVSGSRKTIPEIPAFMETKGYVDRGGSFVNTIFVDGVYL